MKHVVLPALIPDSYEALQAWLKKTDYTDVVQVDIVDGVFAAPASWPFLTGQKFTMCDLPGKRIMLDVMVEDGAVFVAAHADELRDVKEVVVHFRTLKSAQALQSLKEVYKGKLLLAVMNDDAIESYLPYIAYVDGVQVMGIDEIGKQGQSFSSHTIETVRALRKLYPTLDIVVDGSVNETTIASVVAAGVSRVVVGSALLSASDTPQAHAYLESYFLPEEAK